MIQALEVYGGLDEDFGLDNLSILELKLETFIKKIEGGDR